MLPGKHRMALVLLAVGLAPRLALAAGPVKTDPEPEKLVRQLGSSVFAERQAAEKALRGMGAKAAAAVRAGVGNADPEIVRRGGATWPRPWEIEIARPDAERLADFVHPLWARFRKTVGDDPGSRTLFVETVADLRRFTRLESAEADPDKAGDVYAAELKFRVEALKSGYRQAETAARGRSGLIWPSSGIPTRGEIAALLFLGTYPSTATVTLPDADHLDRVSYHNIFGLALHPSNRRKDEPILPALRRLFAAWLQIRTDPNPIQIGMNLAVYHGISEVAPAAR